MDNPYLRLCPLPQDALGGTAYTVVCCNVSPIEASESETLSTLRFAERLKKVTAVAWLWDDGLMTHSSCVVSSW